MEKLSGQLNSKFRDFLNEYRSNNYSKNINIILDYGQRTSTVKVSCCIRYSIFEMVSSDSSNVNIIFKRSFTNLIKYLMNVNNSTDQLCIINDLYYEYDESMRESYIVCEYVIKMTDGDTWL